MDLLGYKTSLLFLTPEFRNSLFKVTEDELGLGQLKLKLKREAEQRKAEGLAPNQKQSNTKHKPASPPEQDLTELLSLLQAMGFTESQIRKAVRHLGTTDPNNVATYCLTASSDNLEEDGFAFDDNNDLPIHHADDDILPDPTAFEDDVADVMGFTEDELSNSRSRSANNNNNNKNNRNSNNSTATIPDSTTDAAVENEPVDDHPQEINPNIRIRRVLIELQRLFGRLAMTCQAAVSTRDLTTSFGWDDSQVYQQHDVHELNRLLFDAIEQSLDGTQQQGTLQKHYRGVFVNKIECLECGHVSSNEDRFEDVSLVVKDHKTIESSLHSVVKYETLDGQNQYHCSRCNHLVDARKGGEFRQLPSIIIFALARFEFDFASETRKKISSAFAFPLYLDMQPYMETGTATTTTSSSSLQQPSGVPAVDQTHATVQDAEAMSNTKDESAPKKKKIRTLHQPPIDTASKHLYELFAVIVHSGGAYGGHYHVYIRCDSVQDDLSLSSQNSKLDSTDDTENDVDQQARQQRQELEAKLREAGMSSGVWFDFNDSRVRPVSVHELASVYGNKHDSAYMLYYRHKSLVNSVPSTPIPQYVQTEVTTDNEAFMEARKQHDIAVNRLKLKICLPTAFVPDNSELLPALQIDSKYRSWLRGDISENGEEIPPEERLGEQTDTDSPVLDFTIDRRDTLDDLLQWLGQLRTSHFVEQPSPSNCSITWIDAKDDNCTVHVVAHLTGESASNATVDSADDDSSPSLQALGFADGMQLVVWQHDHFWWKGNGRAVDLHFKWYRSEDDCVLLSTTVLENETVANLRLTLADMTGLIPDHEYICKVGRRQMTYLDPKFDSQTLFQLGIVTSTAGATTLTVEEADPAAHPSGMVATAQKQPSQQRHTSVAKAALLGKALAQTWEIYVTDNVSDELLPFGSEPAVSLMVEMEPTDTILDLKRAIMNNIRERYGSTVDSQQDFFTKLGSPPEDGCLLARVDRQSGEERAFSSETAYLQDCGLSDGVRVVFNVGKPPKDMLDISFLLIIDGKAWREDNELGSPDEGVVNTVTVHRQSTIVDLKYTMATKVFRDAEKFRIRLTDLLQMPDKLIDDEQATVEAAGLESGMLVWLEKGAPPLPGQIIVRVSMYTQLNALQMADENDPIALAGLSSPALHLCPKYAFTIDPHADGTLFVVSDIDSAMVISSFITLADFKAKLVEKIGLAESVLSAGKTAQDAIRVWLGDRLLKRNNLTLKRLQVTADQHIYIQITPETSTAAGNGTLLYVQQRVSYQPDLFDSAQEVWFDGHTGDQLLLQLLHHGIIPSPVPDDLTDIILFKLNKYSGEWLPIHHHGSVSDILAKPFLLKDGDIVAFEVINPKTKLVWLPVQFSSYSHSLGVRSSVPRSHTSSRSTHAEPQLKIKLQFQ